MTGPLVVLGRGWRLVSAWRRWPNLVRSAAVAGPRCRVRDSVPDSFRADEHERVALRRMLATMRSLLLLSLASASLGVLPTPAQSQDTDARQRAARDLACVEQQQRALATQIQLLREAQAQLGASQQDVRADAARAIESLEQQIVRIAEALRACLPASARLEPQVVERGPTGAAAAVAEANPATEVVERDAALASYLKAEIGERVDGTGRLPASTVRSMVRSAAGRLSRCYDDYVERAALAAGTVILTWTVDPTGRVQRVALEQVRIGDSDFARCLERAATSMRGSRPSGGAVRYSYTLRFGP